MKYEKLRLKWSNIMKIAGKQLLDIKQIFFEAKWYCENLRET